MGNIRNITVTDDRTRKAISNAFTDTILNNEGVFSGSDNAASSIVGKKCELINATVKKWYLGLDKLVITVNGSDVTAELNYPFMNPDYTICVVPEGTEAEDDKGTYITPSNQTIAHVLKQDDEYCVIGFNRGNSTKASDIGEILLQAGNNQISISKEYINIKTNALYINGVKQEINEDEQE